MRVVIADDSVLLRRGAVRLLEDAGFEVVGEAGDGRGPAAQGPRPQARRRRRRHPDAAHARRRGPAGRARDPRGAARGRRADALPVRRGALRHGLLEHGAEGVGYLLKDRVAEVERFTDAIRQVGAGGSVLDPEVVAHMLGRRSKDQPLDGLTDREREVLGLMAEGKTNRRSPRRCSSPSAPWSAT